MKVSAENKEIAAHVRSAFNGDSRVYAYHHDSLPLSIHIASAENAPHPGLTAYSTLSLSDHPMMTEKGEFPSRIEIVGVSKSENEYFPNILANHRFFMKSIDE